MEIVKINNAIPIKAIPKEQLTEIIRKDFNVWLADLLSLTDEISARRLLGAEPAIKEHCWSLGFDEIKKMFEMYADNKLGIEPIPNYFDRILFGKIAKAYKAQRPVKKVVLPIVEISEAEKVLLTHKGILRSFKEFKEIGDIGSGTSWVYDYLYESGVFSFTKEQKQKAMILGKTLEKSEVNIKKPGAKNILEMLEEKRNPRVVNRAKRILLNDYFKIIDVDKLTKKLNDIKCATP